MKINELFLFSLFFAFLFYGCNPEVDLEYEISDLTIIPMDGEILLCWVEPSEQRDYDHTTIFWGQINTYNKKVVRYMDELNPAHTLFSDLENGTEYTFIIAVVDKFGNESEGIIRRATPKDSIKPNEISNFNSEIGSGKIILTWTNPSDVDFIRSEVWATDRFGVNSEHFFVAGSPGSQSTIEIGMLENGYNYNFFVKAIDRYGNSSKIAYIKANPDGTPPDPVEIDLSDYLPTVGPYKYKPSGFPPSPLAPAISPESGQSIDDYTPSEKPSWFGKTIKLQWTNPPPDGNEDFNHVEVWYGPNGQMKRLYAPTENHEITVDEYYLDTLLPKTCFVEVDGLENGKYYNFKIVAIDNVGNSAISEVKLVIPIDNYPCYFSLFDVAAGNSQALLTWENPKEEDFDYLEIYIIKDINSDGTINPTEEDNALNLDTDLDIKLLPLGTLVEGLTNGLNYFFKVILYDTSGNKSTYYYELDGNNNPEYITLSDDIAPDVSSPQARRGNGTLTFAWTEPKYVENFGSGPSEIDVTIGNSPIYLIYIVEDSSALPNSSVLATAGDGDYSHFNSIARDVDQSATDLGLSSSYTGSFRLIDMVVDGDSGDDLSNLEQEYLSLTNGVPYYFKIFVIAKVIGGDTLFSSGRVVTQVPDQPAGDTLPSPVEVTYTVNGEDTTSTYSVDMKYLPAGQFEMGTPFFAEDVHIAEFSQGFWIAQKEVSYGLWRTVYEWAIVNGYHFQNIGVVSNGTNLSKGCAIRTSTGGWDPVGLSISGYFDELPVVFINWFDAIVWCNALTEMTIGINECVYRNPEATSEVIRDSRNTNSELLFSLRYSDGINKIGFQLPTEAQWEYSARYIEDEDYYTLYMPGTFISANYAYYNTLEGVDFFTWHKDNSSSSINRVFDEERESNFIGCFNMSGNVAEWCFDWYLEYQGEKQTNPSGPLEIDGSLKLKVVRGGNYLDLYSAQGTSFRGLSEIDKPDIRTGFRVVRSKE